MARHSMHSIYIRTMVAMDLTLKFKCKQALAFAASAFSLFSLSGCQKASMTPPAPPMLSVSVAHPLQKQGIIDYDEFTARLSAINSVDIHAQVSGYLQKVNFKDGQEVKKGDSLFVIDPRPFQAVLDRVEAELERAKSQLALADNDYNRAKELFKSKAISAEELDTRSKSWAEGEFAVKSAQANLETAKLNLAYTNVQAPIDGRLSRAMVTEGNLVNGGGTDPTLLTTLVSVDPVYAYADVDEATVLKYQELDKEGLRKNHNGVIPADLALGNSKTFAHTGSIDFVNNKIDSTTGTLSVRAIFPNQDRGLIPGQFGRLRVTGSSAYTGLLIPDYAISTDQEKKIVYVVGKDHMVQTKEIIPGQLLDGLRVIRSGLTVDDLVVLDHLQMMRGGMPVSPKEVPLKSEGETGAPATPQATNP